MNDSAYVFSGESLSQILATQVGSTITDDLFRGFDATFSFTAVALSSIDQLLFRLNLDAIAAGTYQIDISSSLSTFLADQTDASSGVAFSSIPGTITVIGAASIVPEPSSAVLLLLACACGLLGRRTLKYPFFFVGATSTSLGYH